jgi:lipid-binding SYLF domain-containing protein
MKFRVGLTLMAAASFAFAADSKDQVVRRIDTAAKVFGEINSAEDKGIPGELLERAQCVGIIPGMKRAGFVIGGNYGKGVLVCRAGAADTGWSGPSMIRAEGGSIGLQIGAGETDVVFIVMNARGMEKLTEDKFTIGGDMSAMAGPVGRSGTANTDAMMHAEILSYSRARGVFAGITLNGSTLRPDKDDNSLLYGRAVSQQEILGGKVRHPGGSEPLYAALKQYAPMKKTGR